MAQPPLSQQILQLERELGVTLLVRSTRKVELTPAGEAYLKQVVAILDAVDEAGAQARRIAEGVEGHLAIGCVGSATYSLLPRLVRALRDELPGVDVSVRGEMLAPAQIAALLSGEIDLALLRPPVEQPGVLVETVRRDRLLVALPEGNALATRDDLSVSDLRDEEFVAHAGHGRSVMNSILFAVCADAGFVPRVRHEVEETSTLVTLVSAGLGVAIVPEPTAALDIAGVCYRPLAPDALGVDLAAARAEQANSPLIERVLAVLRHVTRADAA
jgi:DNA-binding transcriptional LysR family regulator